MRKRIILWFTSRNRLVNVAYELQAELDRRATIHSSMIADLQEECVDLRKESDTLKRDLIKAANIVTSKRT